MTESRAPKPIIPNLPELKKHLSVSGAATTIVTAFEGRDLDEARAKLVEDIKARIARSRESYRAET
jgi:hypothetical protein